MKKQFDITLTIHDGCVLRLCGEATKDDDGIINWDYGRISVNDIWMTDAMIELFDLTCNQKFLTSILSKIAECFRPQEPEDTTTEIKEYRPEIFGELTDQNPVYGC